MRDENRFHTIVARQSSSHAFNFQGPISLAAGAKVQPRSSHLIFCKQHSRCTCCNASSSLAIQKSVQSWLADPTLSSDCRASMVTLACRYRQHSVGPRYLPFAYMLFLARRDLKFFYSSCTVTKGSLSIAKKSTPTKEGLMR